MSEYYPGGPSPFESSSSESPEDKTEKKKKSKETKVSSPEKQEPKAAEKREKEPSVLDKLFEKREDQQPESVEHAKTNEVASEKTEMTAEEASDTLRRIADARELEIGAAELHDANADAAETAEAVAAVELLQNIKEEAVTSDAPVEEAVLIAEARTRQALGLDAETEEDESETAIENGTFINTAEPNEAEIPLNDESAEDDDGTNTQATSAGGGSGGVGGGGGSGAAPGGAGMPPSRRYSTPDTPTPPAERTEYVYYESNAAGAMLLGGIIGYLAGKRRGRIKTEKRLLPVQKKLEREVRDIHAQLIDSEMRIRRLAAEKVRTVHHIERGTVAPAQVVRERKPAASPESRRELQKPMPAERLGRVLMRAEASDPAETAPKLRNITPEHVQTMHRRELLQVGEKIIIEGSSLRQIYESHLIGERGLRRLITEYLRGKDIRKRLRREMIQREIDFERDPILRDKAYRDAEARSASQSLQQLLHDAGVATSDEDDALPSAGQQARYEAAIKKADQRRRTADMAMITVIVVLAAIVAVLLLER